MLEAGLKRPLSIGVPSADLMLFFNGFPWGNSQSAKTAESADIAGIDRR
jgi:hypothetical protein